MCRSSALNEIGLGWPARLIIYGISVLPFVGIVVAASYTTRYNNATRGFGWRLMIYALLIHIIYLVCICPIIFLWALHH